MDTLTINDIDDDLKRRLAARAAVHGRSVEAEARSILSDALGRLNEAATGSDNLYAAIRAIVEPIGGVDELEPLPRQVVRDPPDFR